MKSVFADTYYFIALINHDDADHERVTNLAQTFRAPMVTTEFVLVELADAMATEPCRVKMSAIVETLRALPSLKIVPASSHWIDAGFSLYSSRKDKEWSLTDCISFEVMWRFNLQDALTHDHHFRQAGFQVLL